MKHTLGISVSKERKNKGVVTYRTVSVRERLLRFLFGTPMKLTVIVPGDSIEGLTIQEISEGGGTACETV